MASYQHFCSVIFNVIIIVCEKGKAYKNPKSYLRGGQTIKDALVLPIKS